MVSLISNIVEIIVKVKDKGNEGFDAINKRVGTLRASLLALGPAAIPVAAGLAGAIAPVASALGGAAVAAGVFGAAVIPQIGSIKEASEAHEKYTDAVEKSGAGSKEAKAALKEYQSQIKGMPPATREAAGGFSELKSKFKDWSDSLAGDTMPVFTRGFKALTHLFPLFTPLVKDAGKQLGALATRMEKGVQSKGFKSFMEDVSHWASNGLRHTISGVEKLVGALGRGVKSDGLKNFISYAKENGPSVVSTLRNLAQFIGRFVAAAGPMGGLSFKVLSVMASALNAIPMGVLRILVPTLLGIAAATKVYAAAQLLLNLAMKANPIILIVSVLAMLAVALVTAYQKSAAFREGVQTAFDGVKHAALFMAKVLLRVYQGIARAWLETVGGIIHGAAIAFGWVPGLGDKLKTADGAFRHFKDRVNNDFNSMINKTNEWDRNVTHGTRERKLKANITDWQSKLDAAKKKLHSVPASKRASLLATIRDLESKVRKAKGEIASLHGKTVPITVAFNSRGNVELMQMAHGRRHGGVMGAAAGGPRGNRVWVGEEGPELVDLAPGSMVHTAGDSRRMAAQSSNRGGESRAVLELRSSGNRLDDLLVEVIRSAIKSRGGNVQTVLGQ